MRQIGVWWALAGIGLLLGCSSDDPTSPDANDPYILETTATIGSGGGTLAVDDFELTVPAGAFADESEVELYAATDEVPAGDARVTRTFRLDGVPTNLDEPLTVRLRYDGTLSERSVIAFEMRATANGDTLRTYLEIDATEVEGYLVGELPATTKGGFRAAGTRTASTTADPDPYRTIVLAGATGMRTLETGHFTLSYPAFLQSQIVYLANRFELYLDTITGVLGFEFDPGHEGWPIWAYVVPLPVGTHAEYLRAEDEIPVAFRVNENSMGSSQHAARNASLGNAMIGYTLTSYDQNAGTPANLWLLIAVTVWAQELFVGDGPGYTPPFFVGHEMQALAGIRAGGGRELAVRGGTWSGSCCGYQIPRRPAGQS